MSGLYEFDPNPCNGLIIPNIQASVLNKAPHWRLWFPCAYGAHSKLAREIGFRHIGPDGLILVQPDSVVFSRLEPDADARLVRYAGPLMFTMEVEPRGRQMSMMAAICGCRGRGDDWESVKRMVARRWPL